MSEHSLDALMQRQFPTVIAPKFGQFSALEANGERFVLCKDKVLLEIRRPWVYAVVPITTEPFKRHTPYGAGPTEEVRLLCGQIPAAMTERFVAEARQALPNEHAAWITWSESSQQFRYRNVEVLSHSPGHINIRRPDLDEGEWLVVDVHSHGVGPAFLSDIDHEDDLGELKVVLVVGSLTKDTPSYFGAMRCLGVSVSSDVVRPAEVPHAPQAA